MPLEGSPRGSQIVVTSARCIIVLFETLLTSTRRAVIIMSTLLTWIILRLNHLPPLGLQLLLNFVVCIYYIHALISIMEMISPS
jgi:hypothetical protein